MQPSLGTITTSFAPSVPEILADTDYELLPAMLEDYTHNDFRYRNGVTNHVYPVGALLGYAVTAVGAANMTAVDAGGTTVDQPATNVLWTWSAAGLANHGINSNQAAPATPTSHACVLAKEVDTYYNLNPDIDYIVSVFWRASFKSNGVLQDVDSYAATPWPADGHCTRLSIVPVNR